MKTTNHEYYVSLDVAKLLKEVGFDWKCIRYYQNDDKTLYGPLVEQYKLVETNFNVAPVYMDQYSAPTLEVAQRWLREVKNYDTFVVVDDSYGEYASCILHNKVDEDGYYECFNTYEEALEAGIKKVLELILEEGE